MVFQSVDEYLGLFEGQILTQLQLIRKVIHEAAPTAIEKISYQMPTFYLYGNLVHFAAFTNHIGFYPGASGVEYFLSLSTQYKTSKGTVQFPINEPLPVDLIAKVVLQRVEENKAHHILQTTKKSR
jgi:uncharacterized protein YdhG (YjbR/CyaY superfamily)